MKSCAFNEAEGPGPTRWLRTRGILEGAPAVGSDADIVVLEARRCHIVRAAEMHEAGQGESVAHFPVAKSRWAAEVGQA